MGRVIYAVAAIVLVACFFAIQRGNRAVTHCPLVLDGGIPAVVYVPGPERGCYGSSVEIEEGPVPAVVLAHGFGAKQGMMRAVARRLAAAGYGVVTFDFRGHGENAAGFALPGSDSRGGLTEDFERVVRFARGYPIFDPGRIAVAGHSMGAGAALEYASWDSGLGAVIGISGGWGTKGPYPPANLLLIWADGDPAGMRDRTRVAGAEVAGLTRLVLDRNYGDLERGSGVRLSEVEGEDHVSILYSEEAANRIVNWLEQSLGPGLPATDAGASLGLTASAIGLVAFFVLLWGLPEVTASWVPGEQAPALDAPLLRIGQVTGALVASAVALSAVDLSAGGGPLGFLPIVVSREIATFLGLSGVGLLVYAAARGVFPRLPLRDPRVYVASLIFFGFVYLVLGSVMLPRLDLFLPGHRFWLWPVFTLCFLPWFVATEWLLRGDGWVGILLPIAGKVLAVGGIAAGALLGLLPYVVLLGLPGIALLFAIVEVLAARISRTTPNLYLAGLAQALCTAWVSVAMWPQEGLA